MGQQDWDYVAQQITLRLCHLPDGLRNIFLRALKVTNPAMYASVQTIRRNDFERLRKFA